ncbi:MAG: sigma 54-interacting transcriptional regulator [Anaerovoracaceae bacterium]
MIDVRKLKGDMLMDSISKLFNGKGYIEGITIINITGEILFTAKFNNKFDTQDENYEVVGKKFLDIYENLDENSSTAYLAMRRGIPIYRERQVIKSKNREPIEITSLSIPIKAGRAIVGAIDLSVSESEQKENESVEIMEAVLFGYNKMNELNRCSDEAKYTLEDILTCDSKMLELKDNIISAANCNLPIMIYGETGTGKELVACAVHNASDRAKKPFIVQNCASIPANLMESILFGTSKGAFTGAVDNAGLLELANGGTLFLDEINSMPIELQPKILRVVQEGTFRRVGDKELKRVDVRFLSSTNEPPLKLVEDNLIRKDLYYRLAVLNLEIPPLREREKDIPLLANFFIGKYNHLFSKSIKKVSNKLYEELKKCEWPGNVRELESMIAYGVGMVDKGTDVLEYKHIEKRIEMAAKPAGSSVEITGDSLAAMVSNYEKSVIAEALRRTENNITKAAKVLDLPRQTLSRKVNEYKLL